MMSAEARPASHPPSGGSMVRRRRGHALRRVPFFLLWPSLLLLIVIVVIPFGISIYTSLTDLNQYTITHWSSAPFVGLRNYANAFSAGGTISASLLQSIWASISFSVLTTLIILPVGMIAALATNAPFRGRAVIRSVFLIPFVMPVFVNAITWRLLFMNGWGPVDRLISALHLGSVNTYWLIGPNSFWAMVIADVWAAWPFVYLLVLAGLQQIPSELYEAAAIDGADGWRSFVLITVPLLRAVLSLALLLSTLNHYNNFTLPFVMFGTPPPTQVDVLPLNVYVTSFQLFNLGQGAAMSVITLLIMLIPAFLYIRVVRMGEHAA